jgi:hypothetical protein
VQHRAYTGRASTDNSKPSYYPTNTCVTQKWNIKLSHYNLYITCTYIRLLFQLLINTNTKCVMKFKINWLHIGQSTEGKIDSIERKEYSTLVVA